MVAFLGFLLYCHRSYLLPSWQKRHLMKPDCSMCRAVGRSENLEGRQKLIHNLWKGKILLLYLQKSGGWRLLPLLPPSSDGPAMFSATVLCQTCCVSSNVVRVASFTFKSTIACRVFLNGFLSHYLYD